MPHLSPQTLTEAEQRALLRSSAAHPRDHLIFSLALGTGLRLAEIVGLDVGDVFFPDGAPRGRVRLRREIAKRHRAGDVFLPDALMPIEHLDTRRHRLGRSALSVGRLATEALLDPSHCIALGSMPPAQVNRCLGDHRRRPFDSTS